ILHDRRGPASESALPPRRARRGCRRAMPRARRSTRAALPAGRRRRAGGVDMTTLVARAPGKLFLLGEYAVLDGAPAIVAAVDRFIEVRLTPRTVRTVRITAPGVGEALDFDPGR